MIYESTRNKNIKVNSSQAIIQGLAEDGGLYVPTSLEGITLDIKTFQHLNYQDAAVKILSCFLTDFKEGQLVKSVKMAYDDKFDSKDIVPVKKVGDEYFLELFHGKTLAFKDIALSILPYLMKEAKINTNLKKDILILTATSGDTGKAALEGFKDIKGINIIVFYPDKGVSKVQELQMKSQEGKNTFVYGIKGNFDDAQKKVKNIFNNKELNKRLAEYNTSFSSANSINIGRLIPQIVYYFTSYIDLVNNNEINIMERVNFVVPTGNFGNILAGYLAKEIGLPINKLICASNENNILTDFINTGEYNIDRKFKKTISPSMDILVSSNLERLLYFLSGKDNEYINKLMADLRSNKEYFVNEKIKTKLKEIFWADYSKEEEILSNIKEVYEKNNYIMDTHTAVAYDVYKKYKNQTKDPTKTLILSTASPFKFIESVYRAIKEEDIESDKDFIDIFSKEFNLKIPIELKEINNKSLSHNEIIEIEELEDKILDTVKHIRG